MGGEGIVIGKGDVSGEYKENGMSYQMTKPAFSKASRSTAAMSQFGANDRRDMINGSSELYRDRDRTSYGGGFDSALDFSKAGGDVLSYPYMFD